MLLYPPSTQGLADADRGIEFVSLVDHGQAIGHAKQSKALMGLQPVCLYKWWSIKGHRTWLL